MLTAVAPAEAYRPHLETGLLWVVDDAGEAVAFLAARIAGDRLHIDELDVRQDRQGLGLGRRLLAHAKAEALARGLARLSLTTFRSIPWNAPYYARFGFRGWPAAEAAEDVQQALANETSRGLKDRCAMVMDL
ncbi:GNAT family N-acetyltransferase [Phenylobacterium sp.]|uniref:GNAT family N-acetyltransferase n=1 Tax=Phenylobacterium sp. TaxID=1871053 RepID=UPI0037C85B84